MNAESSPLHIASSRTRTGNLWFPSTSRKDFLHLSKTNHINGMSDLNKNYLSISSKYSNKIDDFNTAQKMKFYVKDFFSKCEQIPAFLRVCSH